MKVIDWLKGWPVVFLGIGSLSAGTWINSGLDAGLITNGIALIIAGFAQRIGKR